MQPKIIIYTTFRPFKGDTNDKIQRLFLQKLKEQTYQNYELAVTIFKEKGVEEALQESGVPHRIYYGTVADDFVFSWTQVFSNAMQFLSEHHEKCFVMWTSADVIFEPNYLENVANLTCESICGISYPQNQYFSIEAYDKRQIGYRAWYGFDSVFFSSDIFTKENLESINRHLIKDLLYYEFFLLAIGLAFCKNKVNLYPAQFACIANDYVALNQTYESTKKAGIKNANSLRGFAAEHGLAQDDFYNWLLLYKVTSNKKGLGVLWHTILVYIRTKYAVSYIRKAMPKIKRILGLKK